MKKIGLAIFGILIVGLGLSIFQSPDLGQVPCRADTSRPAHERIKDCPIPANERASFKGQEIAKIGSVQRTQRQNHEIEIVEINAIEKGVEVFARAWKDGKQIGFGKDGSVDIERFVKYTSGNGRNGHLTHLVVPDNTGDIEVEYEVEDLETREVNIVTKKYREDPKENLLVWLEHTISVIAKHGDENIVEGKRGNTTSTFNPDAATGGDSFDSEFQPDNSTNWDTSHDDTSSTAYNESSARAAPIVGKSGGGNWQIFRVISTFLTSPLGSDTIDSATLSYYSGSQTHDIDNAQDYARIVTASPALDNDGSDSDIDPANYGTTALAPDLNIADTTTSYNDFVLNATGEAEINTSGVTKFGVRTGSDVEDIAPSASNGQLNNWDFSSADEADSNQHPKLVVEHTAAEVPVTEVQSVIWFD